MKKISILYILLSFSIFSSDLKVLLKEYSVLKCNFKEKEMRKELEFSEVEFLKLKKSIVEKELEIYDKKFSLLKEKFQIENNIQKYMNQKNQNQIKIQKLEKLIEYNEKNSLKISKIDLNNLKLELQNEKIKILDIDYKVYNENQKLNELEKFDSEDIEGIGKYKLLIKNNQILVDISEQILKLEAIKKASNETIKNLNIEWENSLKNLEESQKMSNQEIKRIESTIDNYELTQKLYEDRLLLSNENIELYKIQLSKGIISLDNYISKELDYLDIKIDKMDLDSKLTLEKYNLLLWKGKN
ncbi:MAG: hypothetical protein JW924_07640 [Fusobacteriaceae bacterium]|nr:hypothetical protein [Fusobacteriaceae bacterium]